MDFGCFTAYPPLRGKPSCMRRGLYSLLIQINLAIRRLFSQQVCIIFLFFFVYNFGYTINVISTQQHFATNLPSSYSELILGRSVTQLDPTANILWPHLICFHCLFRIIKRFFLQLIIEYMSQIRTNNSPIDSIVVVVF